MGNYLFDKFTYLHFASGIIAYFFKIKLSIWILIHTLFEIIENSSFGIYFINKYLFFWPGGKPKSDSLFNSLGDGLGAILGWLSAYFINYISDKYKLYQITN